MVSLPDIQVVGDRALVRQIIQNLVQNALKYRKPNTVASLTIEAAITRDGGVSLSVTDQGIGFDEGLKDQIFQPFKRLVSKAEFEGSGIGLALVKSITDRHGWAIDCSSQPGMGATFTLNIPAGAIVSDAQSAA
ncbi:MAG: ATP-binding protein [Alphaproteobacteria bacterium]